MIKELPQVTSIMTSIYINENSLLVNDIRNNGSYLNELIKSMKQVINNNT